jgi:hypothetical protein
MPTTLTYSSTTITLDDDMLWTDEFGWQNVVMRTSRTIAGSLIVESASRAKGRPITLAGGSNYGWLARSVVLALRTAANLPGQKMTLSLRGQSYTVMFNNEAAAVEATLVIDYNNPEAADYYVATVRLIEVEA